MCNRIDFSDNAVLSVGTKLNVTLITLTINIISVTVTDGWLLNHDLTAIDDVQALCWFADALAVHVVDD